MNISRTGHEKNRHRNTIAVDISPKLWYNISVSKYQHTRRGLFCLNYIIAHRKTKVKSKNPKFCTISGETARRDPGTLRSWRTNT